jgi:ABC-2 type transport system ATP-binding protein
VTGDRETAPLLEVRDLRKTFPDGTVALRGIDLRIDQPEVLGVVGPDGAGKTTLLRALAGILDFRAEELRVLGHTLPAEAQALKREVGYVPQTWGLYPDMSIRENLQFFAALRGIPQKEFEPRKDDLLRATGLAPYADRLTRNLSGGMKQKLAITCALLHRPRLLILDEPNNGVDVSARQEIWQILSTRPDTLVVISTNYVDEAARCDELIYLMDGRVVIRGSPASILADHADGSIQIRVYGRGLATLAVTLTAEPWVVFANYVGNAIELETEDLPLSEIERRLRGHPAGGERISLVESRPPDMNFVLRKLTRETAREE